jgi:hypothetical protein
MEEVSREDRTREIEKARSPLPYTDAIREREIMEYALGTFLELESGPFACGFVHGRALCTDGKVRTVRFKTGIADTFFSVPASVSVKGKTVSGYVTVETVEGWTTPTDGDPAVVKFIAYRYGKNGNLLPEKEKTQ